VAFNSICEFARLASQVVIVTGGNTGLGKEMVRQFALHNAKVYMASRTESRALAAIEDLKKDHPELADKPEITFLHLDLASLESSMAAARSFLEKEERLDILGMHPVFAPV
jgi:NAD(P)-dependent dehydrogenase (short-subunit alcohol dehydrogenase family)